MSVVMLDGFRLTHKTTMGSDFGSKSLSQSVVFLPPYDRTHTCSTHP